jgi:hypothetical protein
MLVYCTMRRCETAQHGAGTHGLCSAFSSRVIRYGTDSVRSTRTLVAGSQGCIIRDCFKILILSVFDTNRGVGRLCDRGNMIQNLEVAVSPSERSGKELDAPEGLRRLRTEFCKRYAYNTAAGSRGGISVT